MIQTANGSLTVGLDLKPGQSLLIRGGTSSVGMAAAVLAKDLGATVLATTRHPDRLAELKRQGVNHPLVDTGRISEVVRGIIPGGVDAALELVGTTTLWDTLRSVRLQGTVCFTGMLSGQWIVKDFYPLDYIPTAVRLTAYEGGAPDLPSKVFQRLLDEIATGRFAVPVYKVYDGLEAVRQAHADMESNSAIGTLVIRVQHAHA